MNDESGKRNLFGFPYEPYPIQEQLMHAIYEAIDNRKVAILESPTGTGKSLSILCASLSWLKQMEKQRQEDLVKQEQQLKQKIKEANEDDDWVTAHGRKLQAQKELADVDAVSQRLEEITLKLRSANENSRRRKREENEPSRIFGSFSTANKRKGGINADEDAKDEVAVDKSKEEDADLIPECSQLDSAAALDEKKEPMRCVKIIYASRTHSQLEQFALELEKTTFKVRTVTVGSRQALCINEQVRALKVTGLVNDRCNELLNKKVNDSETNKRLKDDLGSVVKKTKTSKLCGCKFAKSDAIEDLADEILCGDQQTLQNPLSMLSGVTEVGRKLNACPYFGSRQAMLLCELVLVPYNILLHKTTREAWGLDLRGNVVIVDEAHNLLQTLSGIHAAELDEEQLVTSCLLLDNYIERFRIRLTPQNLLHIRQLKALADTLLNFLRTVHMSTEYTSQAGKEIVFTLSRFIAKLSCTDIDFFKLIEYLNESKLCKKLRDFRVRFPVGQDVTENGHMKDGTRVQEISSTALKFAQLLDPLKKGKKWKNKENLLTKTNSNKSANMPKEMHSKLEFEASKPPSSSTPLYQLKDFIEALTSKAEDARIIVQRTEGSNSIAKFRFILLNPADKLIDIVENVRSLLLIGGTMKPADQLIDAFERVCGLPSNRILQFSCGHVIDDTQLIALSIARGPDQSNLLLNFASRSSQQTMISITQCFVNLLRHVPNGAVAFFPSYGFLDDFVTSARNSGKLLQIEKIKPVFVESRDGSSDVWIKFCMAAKETVQGALLLAIVGGKLSEGINFSDELGRCVFMVGLPYANKRSIELAERIKYVEMHIGPGAGNRFYETLCIQSVNQAIGRVIRHRRDYAAIVLLDGRYAKQEISNALPGWIRKRLTDCDTFPQALQRFIMFFKSKK